MAVAYSAVGPSPGGGGGGAESLGSLTLSFTHVVGSSDSCIIAGFGVSTASSGTTGMTCKVGSTSMSLITALDCNGSVWNGSTWSGSGQSSGFTAMFYLASPPTGSQTVAFTMTGSTPDDIAGGSVSYTGSGGHGTAVTHADSGSAAAQEVTVSTSDTTGMVVCVAGNGGQPGGWSFCFPGPATGNTSRFQNDTANSTTGSNGACAMCDEPSNGGSVTVGYTGVSGESNAVIGMELTAGGAAPTVDSQLSYVYS